MADNTKIEWADATFNPWRGCTKVSAACDHCYAEELAKRRGWAKWGNHPRERQSDSTWKQPLTWNRQADAFEAEHGRPRMVFCASLADVFDNQVPEEWRHDLWELIASTPRLIWLLLTKRPQNIAKMLPEGWGDGWPNVWLGTTVENQEVANRNIPHLLAVPAAKRFLSIEPMLGPVNLESFLFTPECCGRPNFVQTGEEHGWPVGSEECCGCPDPIPTRSIDWIIAGGESGLHARPSHPDWFRSLRDQCAAAEVPFLFKQWGEWIDFDDAINIDGIDILKAPTCGDGGETSIQFIRGGKSKTGRALDGLLHDGRPV